MVVYISDSYDVIIQPLLFSLPPLASKQPPLKLSPQVRCRVLCGSIEQSLVPLSSAPLKGPEFNTTSLMAGDSTLLQTGVACHMTNLMCLSFNLPSSPVNPLTRC